MIKKLIFCIFMVLSSLIIACDNNFCKHDTYYFENNIEMAIFYNKVISADNLQNKKYMIIHPNDDEVLRVYDFDNEGILIIHMNYADYTVNVSAVENMEYCDLYNDEYFTRLKDAKTEYFEK